MNRVRCKCRSAPGLVFIMVGACSRKAFPLRGRGTALAVDEVENPSGFLAISEWRYCCPAGPSAFRKNSVGNPIVQATAFSLFLYPVSSLYIG